VNNGKENTSLLFFYTLEETISRKFAAKYILQVLSHKQGLTSINSIIVTASYLNVLIAT
jgi:hypothetical protein